MDDDEGEGEVGGNATAGSAAAGAEAGATYSASAASDTLSSRPPHRRTAHVSNSGHHPRTNATSSGSSAGFSAAAAGVVGRPSAAESGGGGDALNSNSNQNDHDGDGDDATTRSSVSNSNSNSSRRRVAESTLNLTLVNPDRYGWTASGGVADLETPHQRARNPTTRREYLTIRRSMERRRQERERREQEREKRERKRETERRKAELKRAARELVESKKAKRVRGVQKAQKAQQQMQQQQAQQMQHHQHHHHHHHHHHKRQAHQNQHAQHVMNMQHKMQAQQAQHAASSGGSGAALSQQHHQQQQQVQQMTTTGPMHAKLVESQQRHARAVAAAMTSESTDWSRKKKGGDVGNGNDGGEGANNSSSVGGNGFAERDGGGSGVGSGVGQQLAQQEQQLQLQLQLQRQQQRQGNNGGRKPPAAPLPTPPPSAAISAGVVAKKPAAARTMPPPPPRRQQQLVVATAASHGFGSAAGAPGHTSAAEKATNDAAASLVSLANVAAKASDSSGDVATDTAKGPSVGSGGSEASASIQQQEQRRQKPKSTRQTPKSNKHKVSNGGHKLPPKTVEYLKAVMMRPEKVADPYLTEDEQSRISAHTGIEEKQLSKWLANYRKRHWKPSVTATLGESPAGKGGITANDAEVASVQKEIRDRMGARAAAGGGGSSSSAPADVPLPQPPLSPEAAASTETKVQVIKPQPTDEDGTLDIYSYHRGRAGCEPRSPNSGDLLCDVDANDTGQVFALRDIQKSSKPGEVEEEKKFVATINISFPLCDIEDMMDASHDEVEEKEDGGSDLSKSLERQYSQEESASASVASASRHSRSTSRQLSRGDSVASQQSRTSNEKGRESGLPQFRDTIEWDLSSPDTPTAMSYATSIASEFGLSFGQTLDLASSIQKQIDTFIRSKNLIRPLPITTTDPFGVERAVGTTVALMPMLYGGVHSGGGSVQVTAQVTKANLSRAGSRVGGSSSRKSGSGGGSDRPRGQVKKTTSKYEVVPSHLLPSYETTDKYRTEVEFRREVVNRAKADLRKDMAKKAGGEDDETKIGLLKFVKDDVCHICHHRKASGVKFCCEGHNHVYCDYHSSTRLGFSANDAKGGTKALDYCPICCLTCLCSKCIRKLDEVAGHFKRQCQNQGVTHNPVECKVDGILELCSGLQRVDSVPSVIQSAGTFGRPKQQKKKSKKKLPEADVLLEDMAPRSSSRAQRKQQQATKKQAKSNTVPRPKKIAKPPPSEFPVEACGGYDLDPSLDDDYRTVFMPDGGSYVCKEDELMPQPKAEEVELVGAENGAVEDGSVDYCQTCTLGGNLICCDRCPRSYHSKCLPEGLTEDQIPDSNWECHLCVRDSSPQPNNDITGESNLGLITASYVDVGHCHGFTEKMLTLAKIHELLLFLSSFDFGYMFENPVSIKDVPDYTKVVKKPMELSTIRANMINGKYGKNAKRELARENIPASQLTERIFDEIALSALKDLELVYHNCYTYNVRGTAIYRMAEVQRRKARMIIKRSIEPNLNQDAMRELDDYARHLKQTREEGKGKPKRVSSGVRNKIDVPFVKGRSGRIVAVFDPTKNMIVKQYTTLKAAVQAAIFIAKLGYASEVPATDYCVKGLVRKSAHDPSLVLFQYRWFYLDDLRAGRVTIAPPRIQDENLPSNNNDTSSSAKKQVKAAKKEKKSSPAAAKNKKRDEEDSGFWIERQNDRGLFMYNSVEAALDHLNKDNIVAKAAIVTPEVFKEVLESTAIGEEITTMGSKWRRMRKTRFTGNGKSIPPEQPTQEKEESSATGDSTGYTSSNTISHPGIAHVFSLGDDTFFEQSMEPAMPDCVIIKEDRISGKIIGGFESLKTAYEDWCHCRRAALCSSGIEPYTMDVFKAYYVHGDKNVEGIQWKPIQPPEERFKKSSQALQDRLKKRARSENGEEEHESDGRKVKVKRMSDGSEGAGDTGEVAPVVVVVAAAAASAAEASATARPRRGKGVTV